MSFEAIAVTVEGGIAEIRLNRPSVLNAITPGMLGELKTALDAAGVDDAVDVIVLTGEGRAFSAGVDLTVLGDRTPEKGAVGGILDEPARAVIDAIQTVPRVVIAKINGFCFTGALEIALACDLIVVAEEAKLGDTHAKWGLRPTWGMSQRLPRAVGLLKARELAFTAEPFTGLEAAEMGLANRAVPLDELDDAVRTLAGKIASNSRGSIAAYKALFREGMGKTLEEGLEFERTTSFAIEDTAERLASFQKKG